MAEFDRDEWRKSREDWRQARRDHRDAWREMRRQRWDRRHSGFGGILIGTVLAGIGVLLLLQNLGYLYVDDIWQYWPVILIVIGFSRIASCRGYGGKIWGGMMILVGSIFLLRNLGYIYGDVWRLFWPVILIFVGLGMLARHLDSRYSFGLGATSSSGTGSTVGTLHISSIFSGARRVVESQEFEGGELNAVFGGIEIDLRKAGTKKDEVILEANAVFGGIEIRVPETRNITVRGDGVFGGYEDKTMHAPAGDSVKRPHLIISGGAVFGGVTVSN
jgi:predicted membrane protein